MPNSQLFHHCIVQFVLELRTVVCRVGGGGGGGGGDAAR